MAFVFPVLLHADTYTFSSAGASGREGPTQSQIDANYSGTNLNGTVTINTQGIQEWTVPADGNYTIEARGASGGNSSLSNNSTGGRGIVVKGSFELSKDEIIKILVGQSGEDSPEAQSGKSAGGGGGTFVIRSPYNSSLNSILLIAGGGGGAGYQSVDGDNGNGSDGSASNSGDNGKGSSGGAGGSSGNAGVYSTSSGTAGGAGYLQSSNAYSGWASAANSFLNGGTGSLQNGTNSGNSSLRGGDGGFGGGGAGAYGGGGGGGFSGGGSGHYTGGDKGGGGGGSYNSGTDQNNTAGFNQGHGLVVISLPQSYVFTSAGATGRHGPTQSQIDANYSGTNLEGAVTINTQGIQEWTVPADGNYSIEAWGAKGGPGKNRSDTSENGGKGAYMSGTFSLTSGYVLKILIGQKGLDSGGGGGTFVVSGTNSALLIAGGGASPGSGGGTGGNLDAVTNNNPANGGTDGSGGSSISNYGAGGGGLLSNGQDGHMALADLLSLTTEWVETERILITATVDLVAEARVVMDFPAGGRIFRRIRQKWITCLWWRFLQFGNRSKQHRRSERRPRKGHHHPVLFLKQPESVSSDHPRSRPFEQDHRRRHERDLDGERTQCHRFRYPSLLPCMEPAHFPHQRDRNRERKRIRSHHPILPTQWGLSRVGFLLGSSH